MLGMVLWLVGLGQVVFWQYHLSVIVAVCEQHLEVGSVSACQDHLSVSYPPTVTKLANQCSSPLATSAVCNHVTI